MALTACPKDGTCDKVLVNLAVAVLITEGVPSQTRAQSGRRACYFVIVPSVLMNEHSDRDVFL